MERKSERRERKKKQEREQTELAKLSQRGGGMLKDETMAPEVGGRGVSAFEAKTVRQNTSEGESPTSSANAVLSLLSLFLTDSANTHSKTLTFSCSSLIHTRTPIEHTHTHISVHTRTHALSPFLHQHTRTVPTLLCRIYKIIFEMKAPVKTHENKKTRKAFSKGFKMGKL